MNTKFTFGHFVARLLSLGQSLTFIYCSRWFALNALPSDRFFAASAFYTLFIYISKTELVLLNSRIFP